MPISIAHYRFNWIDTFALQNNLLTLQNGLLYDVAGRPASPYKTRITTVAAALADSVSAGSIVFTLPAYLQLKNTTEALTNVDVDFGDGNPVVTMAPGGTVTVNYATPGDKIIRYLIRFNNGTSQVTYSYMRVTPAVSGVNGAMSATSTISPMGILGADPSSPCVVTNVRAAIAFQGYEETAAFKGEAEVNTYYANCSDPTLRKPIIVLDGFDPGNTRGASAIYTQYLSYKDINGGNQNLVKDFQARGYDIIILNFKQYQVGTYTSTFFPGFSIPVYIDGGADYIERNAFVLVRLIDSVNAKLASNGSVQKLVIVGPSMGGLISRYALAYMEQHSMPHNTKLWVSFDSPHNGANIPIGDQHFLEYYATKMGGASAKKALQTQINSAAAKQMLLHHYLSGLEAPTGAPNFRDRFKNAMSTIGFPGIPANPSLRRVAITNGSGYGNRQVALGLGRNIVACEKMFTTEIKLSKGVRAFFFIVGSFFPQLRILSAPITLSTSKAYFTPEVSNRCLSFEGTFPINAGATWYTTALNSGTGLDEAPGGYYTTQDILKGQGAETKFLALSQVKFYSLIPNHDFIPTKSALAFTGVNQDLGEDLSGRNLVCTNETPFQSYFTPSTNEEHVHLSQASVTWVTNEIIGPPQQPTYISTIPSLAISGPASFCTTDGRYSITGGTLPSGTSIVWNTGSSIATIASGQGTTQVQLNRVSNGTATMTVALTQTCGINQTLSKSYVIGGPSVTISPVAGACNNGYQTWSMNASSTGPVTSWQWTVDNPSSGSWYIYNPSSPITQVDVKGGGGISVTATNACGTTKSGVTIYSSCPMMIVASPNPATDIVTISTAPANKVIDGSKKSLIYQIRLADQSGVIKKQFKYASGISNVTVSLSGLAKGVYTVQAFDGTSWGSVQIIKQ